MIDVVQTQCPDYSRENVHQAIERSIEHLGGWDRFVDTGQKVLVKPNLLTASPPDSAITTHPEVIRAVAEGVRQAGGIPVVGDSPGTTVWTIQQIWEKTGMLQMAEELGVELVNFETSGAVSHSVNGREHYISRAVTDADVVISAAKLKTHSLTVLTGGIKNLFGTIPGFRKNEYHKTFPNPIPFSDQLLDLYELIRPPLTIVDGIVGMDGQGPAAGRLRNFGMILAGPDAMAIDMVIAHLIGIDPYRIPTLSQARKRGLDIPVHRINLITDSEREIKIEDFQLPRRDIVSMIPGPLARPLARWFLWTRPTVVAELCQRCGSCAKACPVEAIVMVDLPEVDYRACISCGCCREICPYRAMELRRSRIWKLLP
jgi:uncharacterized protein (DUF362 family)/Pyruvate/2-oxoacid:ferredoxin oxidoreductase delta subunit